MYQILSPVRSFDNPRVLYVYKEYYDLMQKIGANLITTYNPSFEDLDKLVCLSDGLLLSGGKDMDASLFNQNNFDCDKIECNEIDELELKLIDMFIKAKKPILGICRGLQTINVYYGGTLIQDIPSMLNRNHLQNNDDIYLHRVTIEDKTLFSKYVTGCYDVNSFHHQCIDSLGKGLKINCYSNDGIVEGIENDDIFAVQWHPERNDDDMQKAILRIFKDRLERKRSYKNEI